MSSASGCFEATFRSDTANLARIRGFVREKAAGVGFSSEALDSIELAVDEACANVMEHAYPQKRGDFGIHLSIRTDRGAFTVVITDKGSTFDPMEIPPPNLDQHLAEFRVGGLGIFLMRSLMDHVDYHIQPGFKNEVRLVKYLSTARP
ncbi:MAG TPA: ATP-binding protein [Pantanalinema sp.]